jgi:crossover junction endodeoxyribonuclease RuvC
MRVLGIDPGSRFVGYGLVDWRARTAVHVSSGVLKADGAQPLARRLATIFTQLQQVFIEFKPEAVAVEGVFTHKNARSALVLGHARGIALLVAAQSGIDVHEYAPARVKKSVGAGGNDSKDSVARMVSRLLSLPNDFERADASDALAVALCHVHSMRAPQLMAGGKRGSSDFYARLKPAVVRAAS